MTATAETDAVHHLPCPFCGGAPDPHTRTYSHADVLLELANG